MPGHPKALSTRSDAYSTTICRISNRETSPLRAPALCSCVTSDPNPSVSEMPYRWEDLRISIANPSLQVAYATSLRDKLKRAFPSGPRFQVVV